MIRFACPSCKKVLKAPEGSAGAKVTCPRCGQRLLVPGLPRFKTVLGELLPSDPVPSPQAQSDTATAQSQPEPVDPFSSFSPNDPQRRPSSLRQVWVAITAFLLASLTVLGTILFLLGFRSIEKVIDDRNPASTTAEQGDLRIGILLLEAEHGNATIIVLAENASDTHMIKFVEDLHAPDTGYAIKVSDDLGNTYQMPFRLNHPTFRAGVIAMRPGEFLIFELPCMEPVDKARRLKVELPSLVVDSKEAFHFSFPLKRETLNFTPATRLDLVMIMLQGDRPPEKVTRQVLYKRDDFQDQFARWNRLFSRNK